MKPKFSIIILIGFLCLPAFAQKKIGTVSKKNILFAQAINNKPAYIYYEDKNNEQRFFYINYNNKNYGPYLYVYYPHTDFVAEHMTNLILLPDEHFGIFHDGNVYGPYATAFTWKFLNEKEYLYPANEKYEDDDDTTFSVKMYCNGKELPGVRDIITSNKNQAKVVAQVSSKKEFYVEYKGNKYGPYDNEIISIDFLADGETLVYKAEKNQKDYIVVNGKENGPFEECTYIIFTKDKKHYAYTYKKNNQDVLVKDGKIFGTYNKLEYYKFNEETGELCVIEYDSKQKRFDLHYAGATYKNVDCENYFVYSKSLIANKDSILYLTSGKDFRSYNACINSKIIQENILSIYPSKTDIYDYAYVAYTPDENQTDPVYLYPGDYLTYNGNNYSINGPLYGVYLFNKKDALYATGNDDRSVSFYLNGKNIYTTQPYLMGDELETIATTKDSVFFTLSYEDIWEQKVYYNGKIYPGSIIENQLVYVDNGNVYLKK